MVENSQISRAHELGMPEGTGKRYSDKDLHAFYESAEALYREAITKAQTEDKVSAYLDGQVDYNIFRGEYDARALTQLWTEAIEHEAVTTPERLFYLGVDILRIRLGKNWFDHIFANGNRENLTAADRFQRPDKQVWDEGKEEMIKRDLPPSTYSLYFYQPAFVSPSSFLSLIAQGEALPDEHIEVIRTPISQKWSKEREFYNQQFVFHLGMPITTHYRSRFYSEQPDKSQKYHLYGFDMQMHSLHELELTPQEIQTFGRRLWQAHLSTPVAAKTKQHKY